ncbi:MAG: glycosyltransferase family 2 protein [Thermodesulfobacteriota bacterium]
MFSVVIPTANRADILDQSLEYVFALRGIEEDEVIVVDDGSNDHTPQVLEKHRRRHDSLLKIIRQQNSGPGAARNRGVREARSELIAFMDDDVFPDPNLLENHARLLAQGFDVSQGLLFWHPTLKNQRFIKFLENRKGQFSFDRVTEAGELSFLQIYTANLVMKKSDFLDCGGFDQSFARKRYAFEDTALGYKLKQKGLRLGLNKEAWAWHLHPITETEFIAREYKVGYAAGVLLADYPDIARELRIGRKFRWVSGQMHLLRLLFKIRRLDRLIGYGLDLRFRAREAFLRGLHEYRLERRKR